MFKKIMLICLCVIIMVSCGRKNELKHEAFLNVNTMIFKDLNNITKLPNKDEVFQ